jgi:hypothetical protein
MRFDGRLCLFLLVLTLSLVCSELPELLTLTDNASNNLIDCAEIALVAQAGNAIHYLLVIVPANPMGLAGPDLLRLLSIQRK